MEQIFKMLNWNKNFEIGDTFSVNISHMHNPDSGRGSRRIRRRNKYNYQKTLRYKRVSWKSRITMNQSHCDSYQCLQKGLYIKRSWKTSQPSQCSIKHLWNKWNSQTSVAFKTLLTCCLLVHHIYQIIYKDPFSDTSKPIMLIKVGEN